MKVKTSEFAHEIEFMLEDYAEDIRYLVADSIHKAASRCLNRIRAASPRLTGDYAKGWAIKRKDNGWGKIPTDIIHNKTDWQLVHLLEFGHQKADGGRVAERPHVRPAAEEADRELVAAAAEAIEKASA